MHMNSYELICIPVRLEFIWTRKFISRTPVQRSSTQFNGVQRIHLEVHLEGQNDNLTDISGMDQNMDQRRHESRTAVPRWRQGSAMVKPRGRQYWAMMKPQGRHGDIMAVMAVPLWSHGVFMASSCRPRGLHHGTALASMWRTGATMGPSWRCCSDLCPISLSFRLTAEWRHLLKGFFQF